MKDLIFVLINLDISKKKPSLILKKKTPNLKPILFKQFYFQFTNCKISVYYDTII
jgi:hypothetical protein